MLNKLHLIFRGKLKILKKGSKLLKMPKGILVWKIRNLMIFSSQTNLPLKRNLEILETRLEMKSLRRTKCFPKHMNRNWRFLMRVRRQSLERIISWFDCCKIKIVKSKNSRTKKEKRLQDWDKIMLNSANKSINWTTWFLNLRVRFQRRIACWAETITIMTMKFWC